MSISKKIKIGVAPTRRNVFSREDSLKYKKLIIDKLYSWGFDIVDIEGINEDGLLMNNKDVESIINKFRSIGVDCIFAPHCNFGTEDVVAKLAKEMQLPFLLWGPRDEKPQPDGSRLRDTQCGLFATSKILQRYSIPFTYLINSRLDDDIFKKGFKNFVAAVNVVKSFRKMRIGQIGTRPGPFWSVIVNEGELLEKFGIEIVPYNLIDIINLAKDIKKNHGELIQEAKVFLKKNYNVKIENEKLDNIISLKEAIKKIKQNDNISGFAIQCWSTLNNIFGIVPCLSNSLLSDEDIPIACETDINGAISSIIAQSATFNISKVIFADITIRHPNSDNKELLWHCGPFPLSLKKENSEVYISNHNLLEGSPAGACNFEVKGGDLSIVRFDGSFGKYSLFVGQAKGDTGPKTKGTYLWIKVKDWTKWEEKIIYGPYIHHVAAVHGSISPVLFEASKYIKGIKLDAIEPYEDEIKDWLAGRK